MTASFPDMRPPEDGRATFIFLGTGQSAGIPEIGNIWGTCDPTNPRNRRTRCSGLVRIGAKNLLIDTGPDLRLQLLENHIAHIDAVLYTHTHADHLYGIDEMRIVNRRVGGGIPFYGLPEHITDIQNRFAYTIGQIDPQDFSRRPSLIPKPLEDKTPLEVVDGVSVLPLVQDHTDDSHSTSFRIGRLAYMTDLRNIREESLTYLKDLEVLILGIQEHGVPWNHLGLQRALEAVERLKPAKTYLTHIGKFLADEWMRENLPSGVYGAYDGLRISFCASGEGKEKS